MQTFIFLGDSITDCNHLFEPENLGYGYVRKIWEQLHKTGCDCRLFNKGYDGFTVPAVRRLWKRDCLTLKPDFITILIGINDLAVIKNTGITPSIGLADFRDQYQELIDDIRITTDCPILLMEPFLFPYPQEYAAWFEDLHKMNLIIKELAEKNHLQFLPLWDKLLNTVKTQGYPSITTDGIHLTPTGHEIIANLWIAQKKQL